MAPGAGATGARASGGGVTCLACRLSKVKCERHPGDVACTRCDRLGLVCTSSGVKKRGAQNVKRDVARLGPAVRSLLANGAGVEASTPASALTCASYRFDGAPVEWCGPRCPAMLMSQIESPIGRQALLQHWICIALRSGSCAILGNVLLLAHLGGLTLDKVQALACDSSAMAPTESIHTPDFVSEWQSLPSPVFTRTQVNGKIEFLPNQRFEQAIGNLKEMVASLAPAPGALITETEPQMVPSTDSLTASQPSSGGAYSLAPRDGADPTEVICASEILLAQFIHPDDTMKFMQLNASLWSSLRGGESSDEMRAEIYSPEPVHIKLAGSNVFTPCALRGRIAWYPSSHRVWTVIDLAPQPIPQPAHPVLLAGGVGLLGPLQAEGVRAGTYALPLAVPYTEGGLSPLPSPSMPPTPSATAAPHLHLSHPPPAALSAPPARPPALAPVPLPALAPAPSPAGSSNASGDGSGDGGDFNMDMMDDLVLNTDDLVSLLARVQDEPGDEAYRRACASLPQKGHPANAESAHDRFANGGPVKVNFANAESAHGGFANGGPENMEYANAESARVTPPPYAPKPEAGQAAAGLVREQLRALRALHTDGLLDESVYRKRQEDLLRMM